MALIGICGALQESSFTLNAILHVAPVDIADRCLAAKAAIRLRETVYMRGLGQQHTEVLHNSSPTRN